jgi:hypothetical protein
VDGRQRGFAAPALVAAAVVQACNDKPQLEPMLAQVERSAGRPKVTSADAGDYREATIEKLHGMGTELLIPPNRQVHGARDAGPALSQGASTSERMRATLRSATGAALYRMRKAIVESVFGRLERARELRRYLLRGLSQVRDEFGVIALTHNMLKLRSGGERIAEISLFGTR